MDGVICLVSIDNNEEIIKLNKNPISRKGGDYRIGYEKEEDKGMNFKIFVQNIDDESDKEYLGSWRVHGNVRHRKHTLRVSNMKIYKEEGLMMTKFVYADNPRKSRKRPLEDCLK